MSNGKLAASMTRDTTRYFFLGLLVSLALTTTASDQVFIEDSPFTVRSAMTREERRHCGLQIDRAVGGSEESDFLGPRPPHIVDLNTSGALKALQHTNSERYTAVLNILDEVLLYPGAEVVSVNGQEVEVDYPPILLTSNPPKRPLRFTLANTRYVAMITLTSVCELGPLK
jgi:hypothetical protein